MSTIDREGGTRKYMPTLSVDVPEQNLVDFWSLGGHEQVPAPDVALVVWTNPPILANAHPDRSLCADESPLRE